MGGIAVRVQHKGIYHRNWLTPLWSLAKQVCRPEGDGQEGTPRARAEAGVHPQAAIQKDGPGKLQTQQLLGTSELQEEGLTALL